MLKQYVQLPRAVHILCLGTFINRAGTLLMPFLTLYLTKEHGLGVNYATLGMGAFGLGSLVGALTGGHLADRIGRRQVMLTSLLGGAVILLIFGSLADPRTILAAVLVFAVLADMYRPAAHAMIADLVTPEHRSHALGLMYVAVNLGFSVGAVVGGKLATYCFQWLFWADALTAAVYAVIIFVLIRETMPARRTHPAAGFDAGARLAGSGDEPARFQTQSAVRHILRDRTFLIFCAGALCVGLVYMQCISTFPIHLDRHGIGADGYGRLIALNGMLIVLLQLPLTAVLSRFNRATVVVWAAVVTAVGFGSLGVVDSFMAFALAVVVWSAGEMMAFPFMSAIVTDLSPVHLRARYLGVFSTCFSSAMMLGAPLGGTVLHHLGGSYLWGTTFAVALIAALLFGSIHRQMTPRGTRASE